MSRTATATPPLPYFPQRNATPSMRHASAPNVSAVHFSSRHRDHHPKKKSKNLPSSSINDDFLNKKQNTASDNGLGLSFEEISPVRRLSSGASPVESDAALGDPEQEDEDESMGRITPAPSMTTSSSDSLSTTLPTPSSSRAPSFSQPDLQAEQPLIESPVARPSWVPYLGKMAKAVVTTTGFSMPFTDKKKKDVRPAKEEAIFVPTGPTPQPTREELAPLSEEAAMNKRREWAMEQQRRVTECARLCSQWPHSGYNQSKWGPNGSRNFYEPQSYANPQYVATLMARQADLERTMHENSSLFFSCRHSRASSEDSDPSMDSYESSAPSPTASFCLSADLSAAMASPLISSEQSLASSSLLSASPQSQKAQSLKELDVFASTLALDSSAMDIDQEPRYARPPTLVRSVRAQSCGAKRPLTAVADEEEKRRKVDEAMVVEDAVADGVIVPGSTHMVPSTLHGKHMSASVPNLSVTRVESGPSVFGHVVKTSDTHPIIISPFFPSGLLVTIAEALIIPAGGLDQSPLVLGSKIDVPSLLLSYTPSPSPNLHTVVPSPVKPAFDTIDSSMHGVKVGNLLLSSCPGKRLRMEGPVKGRGPVCRDLATDLRRIKSEGVGCLVCCLDDSELALLGVPWETYSAVAAEIGLDVIRMPMPDGFTPVSLSLFDTQVSLVVTQYSLRGINVLIHCRGGVGRAGLTASAWAIKMGFVPPHPSLALVEEAAVRKAQATSARPVQASSVELPAELEHQIVMSIVERVIAMIRARRGLKAIESFEQVQFLASYVKWLRASVREEARAYQ